MTEIDFGALQEAFPAADVEWRLQQAGEKNSKVWAIVVPYITNRAIMQRLDDVVGPGRWRNEYVPVAGGGFLCGLSVKVDGEWVTKWDGAEVTDVEPLKGGLSGAMKRAAVQWGIGRALYTVSECFANVHEDGQYRGKTKDGKPFRWDPPALPASALPKKRAAKKSGGDGAARQRQEHEAMLEFIKAVGPRVGEEAAIEIDGRPRNLRQYVRENWPAMKEQPALARAVVDAVGEATGTKFDAEAA